MKNYFGSCGKIIRKNSITMKEFFFCPSWSFFLFPSGLVFGLCLVCSGLVLSFLVSCPFWSHLEKADMSFHNMMITKMSSSNKKDELPAPNRKKSLLTPSHNIAKKVADMRNHPGKKFLFNGFPPPPPPSFSSSLLFFFSVSSSLCPYNFF